jgi:phage recombination protein Bet
MNNSLNDKKEKTIEYESNGAIVKLSSDIVKKYLVNGNGNVSDQEVVMFLNLCKAQHLNPFLREAYLIKYGTAPASIITGKEVFTKRARRNESYAGHEAGVIVQRKDASIEYRAGTLLLKGEDLVGGWAKVHIKGDSVPLEITVTFSEYCLYKDGKPASNWAVKPATMIRKVALVQALREAFPEDLQGMYDAAESSIDDQALSDLPPTQDIPALTDQGSELIDPLA